MGGLAFALAAAMAVIDQVYLLLQLFKHHTMYDCIFLFYPYAPAGFLCVPGETICAEEVF